MAVLPRDLSPGEQRARMCAGAQTGLARPRIVPRRPSCANVMTSIIQVPCIERNARASIKAINAAQLASTII